MVLFVESDTRGGQCPATLAARRCVKMAGHEGHHFIPDHATEEAAGLDHPPETPLTEEELAAMQREAETPNYEGFIQDDALRLIAEMRRLRAELARATPGTWGHPTTLPAVKGEVR